MKEEGKKEEEEEEKIYMNLKEEEGDVCVHLK